MLAGIRDAQAKIAAEQPDRIITIGGNCMVSLAAFDTRSRVYLHGSTGMQGLHDYQEKFLNDAGAEISSGWKSSRDGCRCTD